MTKLSLVNISDLIAQSGVAFGTSGSRGSVAAMTDAVCFAYTAGFLQYVASLGKFVPATQVALAGDLCICTPPTVAAYAAAIEVQVGIPLFCGVLPSPALALYTFSLKIPSLMVTGSHIHDDLNGIKFHRISDEVLKPDEAGMKGQRVAIPVGLFNTAGTLLQPKAPPPPVSATSVYIDAAFTFSASAPWLGGGSTCIRPLGATCW